MAETASGAAVPVRADPPRTPERPEPAAAPKLDELMLAMDVVDTIRHQDLIVERELGQADRDAALKERLRQVYESQGLDVTDRILDAGIAALKESRFTYTPPPPGWRRTLARMWIRRGTVAIVLAVVVVLAAAVAAYSGWQSARSARLAEAARIELTETLPRALESAGAGALDAAAVPEATAAANMLIQEGEAALTRGDREAARGAIEGLNTLRAGLIQDYELTIVSRPGADTGVFRVPDVNRGARNYYLVVEAIGPEGTALAQRITSEEDGSTRTVTQWAVRVPEATYNAVAADKQDDGIVENDIIGEKPRGQLEIEYRMPVLGGAITEW